MLGMVFNGGGLCYECAQAEVRLASYVTELARSVDAAGVGDSRNEYDVIASPSLYH